MNLFSDLTDQANQNMFSISLWKDCNGDNDNAYIIQYNEKYKIKQLL